MFLLCLWPSRWPRARRPPQRGLETALSLIPPGSPGTILLLTDGRWTGRDPGAAMLAAADRGVPLDFRLMQRSTAGENFGDKCIVMFQVW